MLMWHSSLVSRWSSYKGLKSSAALGCLLLWATHMWRFGTSGLSDQTHKTVGPHSRHCIPRPSCAQGLQALVRLYYSNRLRLGYAFPALPNSFQLLDGHVVLPRGRLVPFRPSSGINSRAAHVFCGSVEEMPVVSKTSARMSEEIKHHWWVKELGGRVTNLPEMLGTAQHADRDWLVTP